MEIEHMTHRTKRNLTYAIRLLEVSLNGLLAEHRAEFRSRLVDLRIERDGKQGRLQLVQQPSRTIAGGE
jgi:hypothetical protein